MNSRDMSMARSVFLATVTSLVVGYFTAERSAALEFQQVQTELAVMESQLSEIAREARERETRVLEVERDIAALRPILEEQGKTIRRIADRLGVE